MTYIFQFQRHFFNPFRFGLVRTKKIKANTELEAAKKMFNYINSTFFNVTILRFAGDNNGNKFDLKDEKYNYMAHLITEEPNNF